jgi:hypothetical protein
VDAVERVLKASVGKAIREIGVTSTLVEPPPLDRISPYSASAFLNSSLTTSLQGVRHSPRRRRLMRSQGSRGGRRSRRVFSSNPQSKQVARSLDDEAHDEQDEHRISRSRDCEGTPSPGCTIMGPIWTNNCGGHTCVTAPRMFW